MTQRGCPGVPCCTHSTALLRRGSNLTCSAMPALQSQPPLPPVDMPAPVCVDAAYPMHDDSRRSNSCCFASCTWPAIVPSSASRISWTTARRDQSYHMFVHLLAAQAAGTFTWVAFGVNSRWASASRCWRSREQNHTVTQTQHG